MNEAEMKKWMDTHPKELAKLIKPFIKKELQIMLLVGFTLGGVLMIIIRFIVDMIMGMF